jgi:photosystem II stability/assembly factor-like uncharacterized protein
MRGSVVLLCLLAAHASAEPDARGPRWQQSASKSTPRRVWGVDNVLYGIGDGVMRSLDGGATWGPADANGPASSVWASAPDDVWIVRSNTLHHSTDGKGIHWIVRSVPALSFGAAMTGMWGIENDRYLFGMDRSDGAPRGTILRSRDRGVSWRRETLPVAVDRITGVWGSAADDIYAVGARGVVLHSAGDGTWRVVRRPGTGSLEAIWGIGPKSIFAVGTNGAILHSADRGKTWVPRASGVRYTLSSVIGVVGEILVGSATGAPLRSTDGVRWKPITAMVSRGDVWARDREHVVVASSSGVSYLGVAPPIDVLPQPLAPWHIDGIAGVRAQQQLYAKYPHVSAVLKIAAREFDANVQLPAALKTPGQVALRLGAVKGCSAALDRGAVATTSSNELVIDLTCETPCSAGAPKVTAKSYLPGTTLESSVVVDAAWCRAAKAELAPVSPDVLRQHQNFLGTQLTKKLAAATDNAEKADALAEYVLGGGNTSEPYLRLAGLLSRSVIWRGFFWNSDATPQTVSAVLCKTAEPARLEREGDVQANNAFYKTALGLYEQVAHCETRVLIKAFALACQTRDFAKAVLFHSQLPRASARQVVNVCRKEGFDPADY